MFPPMEGGLPDHTDHLAEALRSRFQVAVLTSPGVETQRPFPVHPSVDRWHHPRTILAQVNRVAPSGPVLWQYVPHMYGRGGVNLALPRVWRELRRLGRRQLILAHEIAAPFSLWPHRAVYALVHRLLWRAILRHADAIGISTGGWFERLAGRIHPPDRLFLACSPSNLPVLPTTAEQRAAWRAANLPAGTSHVLGFFGSTGAGKQFEWVLEAWQRIRQTLPRTALVVIGDAPNLALAPGDAGWLRPLGYLPSAAASEALQSLDLLLLPFIDGVSERRSSFMAGLAHGLPILTTWGPATSRQLRSLPCFRGVEGGPETFSAAATELLMDADTRARMAEESRIRYLADYDWPGLAARLAERLSPRRDQVRGPV